MSQIKPHPSNVLSSGEVTDFVTAMNLVIQQCELEARLDHIHCDHDAQGEHLQSMLHASAEAARRCKATYLERVKAVERELAREWQNSDSEEIRSVGVALDSGEYSLLAI